MASDNVEVVQQLIDAWNRRDLEAALERLHPNCELRPVESIGPVRGHEEFAVGFEGWFEAFEEFTVDPQDFLTDGDRVLVPVTQRALGAGSGIEVSQGFHQLFTLRDGLVVRFDEFADEDDARRAFLG